jgi:anti-sigma factor RsiW
MTCGEVSNNLERYVDSELSAAEVPEFDSHLRDCASCAAQALGLLQMKLRTRAAATRYSPTPEFRLRLEKSIRPKRSTFRWFANPIPKLITAAIAAVLLIGSVTLWMGHSEREHAFSELADLHVSTLASANPVDVVSTDRHTVKPWFAGKLPFTFNLPELQNSGFTLVGGRVAYFQHNSGAQLLFGLRKHQLSVFIFPEQAGEIPFRVGASASTKLAFHMETWSEGGLRYFVVSDAPASDVHALSVLLKNAARS